MIAINEKNRAKIEAMLKEANGRATAHTITSLEEVLEAVEEIEERAYEFISRKSEWKGMSVTFCPDLGLPKSYRNRVTTTEFTIARRASGWFLVEAESVNRYHDSLGWIRMTAKPELVAHAYENFIDKMKRNFCFEKPDETAHEKISALMHLQKLPPEMKDLFDLN